MQFGMKLTHLFESSFYHTERTLAQDAVELKRVVVDL